MGRAINDRKDIDDLRLSRDNHDKRIKLVEDALAELIEPRVHHVDLSEDEEYTMPVGKRTISKHKKTTKKDKTVAAT